MQTTHQKGFGLVALLIAVAVVVIVGFVAWRIGDASTNQQTHDSTNNHGNNSQDSSQQEPEDPYAGWKAYCDDTKNACFKHPADWIVEESLLGGGQVVSIKVNDPTGGVEGSYSSYDTRDGTPVPYYTAVLQEIPGTDYSIVGGYAARFNYPVLKVVDTSLASHLKVGETADFVNTARYTFKDGFTGHFEFQPTNYDQLTVDQARAWFTSDDAKTAMLILESFSIK